VLVAVFSNISYIIYTVTASSLLSLGLLGAISAKIGGANTIIGTIRVTFWGILAMALTASIGALFGAHI